MLHFFLDIPAFALMSHFLHLSLAVMPFGGVILFAFVACGYVIWGRFACSGVFRPDVLLVLSKEL
jgi:hypothetical protein